MLCDAEQRDVGAVDDHAERGVVVSRPGAEHAREVVDLDEAPEQLFGGLAA
jgi:hypothetical protein